MEIEQEILRECSKEQCLRIAKWIGTDRNRLAQLMEVFLKGEYRTTQRAAWIVKHYADVHRELMLPYLGRMTDRMLEPGVHDAVRRNVLRVLQDCPIPKNHAGKIANACFNFLGSAKEPIAVKVFAMTVLSNIAMEEPDLSNELRLLIEQQWQHSSAGFRSRGSKILKRLSSGKPPLSALASRSHTRC